MAVIQHDLLKSEDIKKIVKTLQMRKALVVVGLSKQC